MESSVPTLESFATSATFSTYLPEIGLQPASHLVFVDSAIAQYEQLIAGISASAEVILLNTEQAGIHQISEVLRDRQNIASLHLISHAQAGRLALGSTEVDSNTLFSDRDQLAIWANALTDTADILLYGCNVAQGETGQAFIRQLSQLTGADVAASDDLTGNADLGGDWVLEARIGEIEAAIALTPELQQSYAGVYGDVSSDALVTHLTFDETAGTQAADISPYGTNNAGSLKREARFSTTHTALAGAVTLDGIDDYVELANSSDINLGSHAQRTIATWFKVNDTSSASHKQVIYEEGGASRGLNIYVHAGQLYVGGWNEPESGWAGTFLSTDAIRDDTWHQVTLVLEAEANTRNVQPGAFRAYLDGVLFGEGSGSQLWQRSGNIGIGAINNATQFHSGDFNGTAVQSLAGEVADFRIYNRALSALEVETLSTLEATSSPPPNNLAPPAVMHLAFDEPSGTQAADTSTSGLNNPGTLRNGAVFVDTGNALAGAVEFDGVNDYVSVNDSSDINVGTFSQRTVSLWFQADDVNVTNRKQVLFEGGGATRGLNVYLDSGQIYVGGWNLQESGWSGTYLSTDAVSHQWHHVALVLETPASSSGVESNAFVAYLDGVEFGRGEGSKLWSHTDDIGFGAINGGTRFHSGNASGTGSQAFGGRIADARLYNQALSQTEIADLASLLGSAPIEETIENFVFPEDAGVVDVTDYGAIPNDGLDDTAAIQQALNENTGDSYIFYFQNGVYDISNTLTLGASEKRSIFQGQSEAGTVLRLMDSVSPSFSGAILQTGGINNTTADRFRNAVRNLTLNIGVNKPNAKGLQFWANNQGTVKDVTILSEDGQGDIGLDMAFDDAIGPLLVQGLTVDGFDYGIVTRWPTASQTFEDITLTNQNVYGWWNTSSQRVFARDVKSTNAVTAILNNGEAGFVLTDSVLTGIGAANNLPAIVTQKSMYISNTETSGYSLALDNIVSFGRGNPDVLPGYIEAYSGNGSGDNRSGAPFELFDSPDRLLKLPVEDAPVIPWDTNFSNWSGPHLHVTEVNGVLSGVPNDLLDDTAAIQAAIDSGASTIYIPQGEWALDGTLNLRGNVVRFIGTEALLEAGPNGVIRILDDTSAPLVIERLEGLGRIEHASDRTLVLNNLQGFEYVPGINAPGDVFINDSVGAASTFRNQRVWARQLNIEGNNQADPNIEAKILNDNSQVWILGLKTEDPGTVIKTINGGSTELLGTFHAGSGTSNTSNPRFVTVDAAFSVAGVYGGNFARWASETRNGTTRTTNTFNLADAYTAYAFGDELWGHWAFEGTTTDSSSYSHDGALAGGAGFSGNAAVGEQSLRLNGNAQSFEVPNFLSPSQQITLATWVKSDRATWNADNALISKGDGFRLAPIADTQRLSFGFVESQKGGDWRTVEFDLASLTNFDLTSWHHYAATYNYNTGDLRLYVDGLLRVNTRLTDTPQLTQDLSPLQIGYNAELDTYFAGQIDEVRLYGRALSSAEIAALAAA
ncbi:DUF4347 domain-containing protein [Almyronema epifaneia]|uniref:DUF4347 domain-containing protein n=1 Tax=Almyronema epifaneia S1 TaxID=2991925 RepID=A0ABW6IK33_9CYAN